MADFSTPDIRSIRGPALVGLLLWLCCLSIKPTWAAAQERIPSSLPLLHQSGPASFSFYGIARSRVDGRVLYREDHQLQGQCLNGNWHPHEEQVDYSSSDGQRFAEKKLEYRKNTIMPDFALEDQRFKLKQSVHFSGAGFTVQEDDKQTLIAQPSSGPPIVVDAGFDYFIRAHWDQLIAGKPAEFRFIATGRQTTINMQIMLVESAKDQTVFRLELTNPLLRWFVDPILVQYDPRDRELTSYTGLTNIRETPEQNFHARITYSYPKGSRSALCKSTATTIKGLSQSSAP